MFVYVTLFLLAWVLIGLACCKRKWGQRLSKLLEKKAKLEEQQNYDKFNEGPA
jgi:hypothetical protein